MSSGEYDLSLSRQMPFTVLTCYLQRCSDAKNAKIRKEIFSKFAQKWLYAALDKAKHVALGDEDSFFNVLRLCLPRIDNSRKPYGLKDKALTHLFADIMGIAKGSSLHNDLTKFESDVNGNLAKEISMILVKFGHFVTHSSQISIYRVNKFLDSLHRYTDKSVKLEFRAIINGLKPDDVGWLISIILKNIYFGLQTSTILKLYHKDAPSMFLYQSDLLRICLALSEPSSKIEVKECHKIVQFTWFHPMLAMRRRVGILQQELEGIDFYIEIKYDGERFQLHKSGEEFLYFSKNGHSKYSDTFGRSVNEGTLTSYFRDAFPSDIESIVLDGEMMLLNPETKQFVGMAQTNKSVKNRKVFGGDWSRDSSDGLETCYVVFDVLHVNGKTLADLPFDQRLEILQRVVSPVENKLVFAERLKTKNAEEISKALHSAIVRGDEGLIIKKASSKYQPGIRGGGDWFKVKPDFSDQLLDTLDLLVMGADYGDHRYINVLKKFAVGVRGDNGEDFYVVANVSGGFNDEKLREINLLLGPICQKTSATKIPPNMHFSSKPKFWFPPYLAPVFKIKATDVIRSSSLPLKRSLRFPQFREIRKSSDVNFENCTTSSEFKEFHFGSLAKPGITTEEIVVAEEGAPSMKKRKLLSPGSKSLRAAGAVSYEDRNRLNEIAASSAKTFLSGKEICVYHPPDDRIQEIQESLAKFGARFVCEATRGKTHLIVSYKNSVRVQSLDKTGSDWDVLTGHWLDKCFTENTVITPRSLKDFFFCTPRTRQYVADKFGNPFIDEEKSLAGLKALVRELNRNTEKEVNIPKEDVTEFMDSIHQCQSKYHLFRRQKAYFSDFKPDNYLTDQQFYFSLYGGKIAKDIQENGITHIMADSRNSNGTDWLDVVICKKLHLVKMEWIADCIKEHTLLEERLYQPR